MQDLAEEVVRQALHLSSSPDDGRLSLSGVGEWKAKHLGPMRVTRMERGGVRAFAVQRGMWNAGWDEYDWKTLLHFSEARMAVECLPPFEEWVLKVWKEEDKVWKEEEVEEEGRWVLVSYIRDKGLATKALETALV